MTATFPNGICIDACQFLPLGTLRYEIYGLYPTANRIARSSQGRYLAEFRSTDIKPWTQYSVGECVRH